MPTIFTSFDLKTTFSTVALTEAETEYVVSCVKHVFASQVVLQFNLTNTLNDQKLENVKIVLTTTDQVFKKGIIVTAFI